MFLLWEFISRVKRIRRKEHSISVVQKLKIIFQKYYYYFINLFAEDKYEMVFMGKQRSFLEEILGFGML